MFNNLRPWQVFVVAAAGWLNRQQGHVIDSTSRRRIGFSGNNWVHDGSDSPTTSGDGWLPRLLGRMALGEVASLVTTSQRCVKTR
jgi:hypothetical protein